MTRAALAAAFAGWLATAALPAGAVRTCFRLVEPPDRDPRGGELTAADPAAGSTAADPAAGTAAATAADGPDAWQVEFSLQSVDDPSLMLPAADVWAGEGSGWLAGTRSAGSGHPEEELLAGLGTAARLFPALDGALRSRAPTGSSWTPRRRWPSCATRRRCCPAPDSACCCRTGPARRG